MNSSELEHIRATVLEILDLIAVGDNNTAFEVYIKQNKFIQDFVAFLEQEMLIETKELEELATYLVQAMEMRDIVLLEDTMRYAVLDILNQLLVEEANDAE